MKCCNSREQFENLSNCKFGSQTRDPLQKLTNAAWNRETTKTTIKHIKTLLIRSQVKSKESIGSEAAAVEESEEVTIEGEVNINDENELKCIISAMEDLDIRDENDLLQICWHAQWWNCWIKICLFYENYKHLDIKLAANENDTDVDCYISEVLIFKIPCGINIIIDGIFKKNRME